MATLVSRIVQESHPGKEQLSISDVIEFIRTHRSPTAAHDGDLQHDAETALRLLRQGIFDEGWCCCPWRASALTNAELLLVTVLATPGMFTLLWKGVPYVDVNSNINLPRASESAAPRKMSLTKGGVPWRQLVDLLCRFQVCVRLPKSPERWFVRLLQRRLGVYGATFAMKLQVRCNVLKSVSYPSALEVTYLYRSTGLFASRGTPLFPTANLDACNVV